MSGAEQFTAVVPERSGPTDWRDGLERSGAATVSHVKPYRRYRQ